MYNRRLKAQSAMEYLMTYGWAILIIAVVLGALFSLGVFGGASLLGNSCIAGPGFLCGSMVLSHTNGYLGVQIGQSTGTNWANAIILYAAQGNTIGSNGPVVPAPAAPSVTSGLAENVIGAFVSGQTVTVYLQALPATSAVGASSAGSIWACYTTVASAPISYNGVTGTGTTPGTCYAGLPANAVYYTQIATLTVKAT